MSRFTRPQTPDGHSSASTLELFYDLVFVFAVTQVSHALLEHLDWTTAGQQLIVLIAVWWSWNYTTWVTNELDTDAPAVRGMVIAVMLGSLLMAIAIPYAWGERALLFAGAYVAIQVGRHAFLAFVCGSKGSDVRLRASHIFVWFCFSGVFWIAGAIAPEGTPRTVLWILAVLVDLSGPFLVFHIPGMKQVTADIWNVTSEHFAERFQLFIIIALGESIVITGATTAELALDAKTMTAFIVAFLGSAAFWWLYFNRGAQLAARQLDLTDRRTELARDLYTYMHIALVAGIILFAIGDEIVILHPDEHLHTAELIVLAAGPALFLTTLSLMRLRAAGSPNKRRLIAALTIVAIVVIGQDLPALALSSLILGVLVVAIIVDEYVFRHRRTGP
ncbi:MAG: low temperature requirement protein A [Solirubrobacterales bacterium]